MPGSTIYYILNTIVNILGIKASHAYLKLYIFIVVDFLLDSLYWLEGVAVLYSTPGTPP